MRYSFAMRMLNRRTLLRQAGVASAALALRDVKAATAKEAASPDWRNFEVVTRVEVTRPSGTTRIWIPLPLTSSQSFQKTLGNTVDCEAGKAKISRGDRTKPAFVWAEFAAGTKPALTVTSRVATRDWSVELSEQRKAEPDSAELDLYRKGSRYLPIDGIVGQRAKEITEGQRSDAEKAHAIYEWVVDHTYRNPKTRGCGLGDIRFLLESGDLGGKCADINSLYVGLARAAGLPARDAFGIRLSKLQLGSKSLGLSSEDATKAQHCRAEVYLREAGWVPVDPADVRKVMLEEPPGKRGPEDEMVRRTRRRLFGSWEMNWMAYNFAHDVELPGSSGAPLRFLMYPVAETSDGRLDSLDPESFRYTITSHQTTSNL